MSKFENFSEVERNHLNELKLNELKTNLWEHPVEYFFIVIVILMILKNKLFHVDWAVAVCEFWFFTDT